MPKGNHSEKTKSAIVVLNDGGSIITDKSQLATFQKHTAEQVALIERTESDNVLRRIFVGLALWRIKASLKHGEFGPWLKKHVEAKHSNVNYIMRAAQTFVEETRLAKPEQLALATGEVTLETKDATAKKVLVAAEKFVDGMSWGELLDFYGIKDAAKTGGKRTKSNTADGGSAPSNEELYQFARDEIGLVLTHAETLFVKENRLQHLADHPEEVRGVAASLRKLADQVEEAVKSILKK